jgi:hypothetical protein
MKKTKVDTPRSGSWAEQVNKPEFLAGCKPVDNSVTLPTKYRADIQGVGENVWSTNALEFDTPEAAAAYAQDLGSRWLGMEAFRVVTAATPRGQLVRSDERRPV